MINLINGDCLIELSKMEGKSIDHCFTSPPYNRKRNDKYALYNDDKVNYFEWQSEIIKNLLRVTKKYVIYNIQANYYNRNDVYRLIGENSEFILDIFIWEKKNPMPASGKSITNAIEYFIIMGNEKLKSNKTYTKNIISTSVNSNMPKNHKAVMKQEVADHFISLFTKEGDTVLDPFMGLGTTGVSCLNMNRKFIGIELIEEYYNEAKKILQKELTWTIKLKG